MNAPFLKILGKILENALRFRQIRIGEYRNKFIAAAACGKAPYGTEVFIDIASQTPYGHLCRIMACARPDDIQIIQRKNRNAVGCPACCLRQLNMMHYLELPFGIQTR